MYRTILSEWLKVLRMDTSLRSAFRDLSPVIGARSFLTAKNSFGPGWIGECGPSNWGKNTAENDLGEDLATRYTVENLPWPITSVSSNILTRHPSTSLGLW